MLKLTFVVAGGLLLLAASFAFVTDANRGVAIDSRAPSAMVAGETNGLIIGIANNNRSDIRIVGLNWC